MKNWFLEHKKGVLLSLAGTLLPMVIGLILWNQLPDRMVTHWGADAVPDGVSPKVFAVFGLPVIMAALNLAALAITAADPGHRNQNKKALGMVFWILPMISLTVTGVMYAIALGKTVDVTLIVPLLLGVLFVMLGNYMPKVTQNKTLGIKIYWTLNNEENWNKTHRFAGKCWVAGGLIMLLTAALPVDWMFPVMLLALIPLILAPVVYSYLIYRGHKAQGIEYAQPAGTKQQKWNRILVWVLILAILAAVAAMLFSGSITYTCGEETLRIESTAASGLEVAYQDLDSIELREDFDMGQRVMGYGSFWLSMGFFQNDELGDYTLYAHNSCDTVILIRSGDKYLAINAGTPEETRALYETLLEKVGE